MTGPLNALQAVKKWPNAYKSLIMIHEIARIETIIYLKFATLWH